MVDKYRLARRLQAAQKALTLLVLFCFLAQPAATFAAVITGIPVQSGTDTTTATTSTPPPATDPSTNTSSNSTPAPDTTATPPATTPVTTGTTNTSASAPSTNTAQTSATPSTTATPDTGAQPLLAPGAPNDNTESPDLARKAIDPKYYSETDPVTGSLSYTYPVTIPPGRNGLQPTADLSYTSQPSPNTNIMGYGWDTKIPYIERINRMGTDSLYTQNYFYSSIDGEIFQTATSSSTWGARVENGSFNQYQFNGATSTAYWVMTDKSGNTYTFGTTTASRLDNPSNGAQIYKWELEKVQDTNGNYVTYQYYKDKGEIYPFKITYTNASSTPGIYEVDYATTTRADMATSTTTGFPVISEYLINNIAVKVNGVLTHNYALTYTNGANGVRSLLSSIVESGYENGATTTLPAVHFTYTEQAAPLKNWNQTTTYVAPLTFSPAVTLADVNGDGLIDIVHAETGTTSLTYLNNASNGWTASSTWTSPVTFWNGSSDQGVRMVDVNGDGLPDIVQSFYSSTSTATTTGVYINNGSGWTASTTITIPFAISNDTVNDLGIRFVDVNGDGLPDIIQGYQGNRAVYINNGHGWTYNSSWTVPVDFITSGTENAVRIEDINGDGLPDLVQANGITTQNNVWINTGSSWALDPTWTIPVEFSNTISGINFYDTQARFMDVNGDGLPDIVQSWENSVNGGANGAYINTGHGWVSDPQWDPTLSFGFDNTDYEVRFADVNGDGLLDMIPTLNAGTGAYTNNASTPDLLSKVTFADGGSANYTYEGSQQYRLAGQPASPNLPLSLDTVSGIGLNNGLGVVASTTYTYQGGKYYYGGPYNRQFAGFQKVVKTDGAGNVTNTYYHQGNTVSDTSHGEYQDAQPKIGKVYRAESYDNASNLYAKSIFKWDMNPLSGGREFVDQLQEVDSTYDGTSNHTDKATSNTYDLSNGDVLSTANWGQVSGNDDGTFTDTGTDLYTASTTYATSSSPYYIAVPDDKIVTNQSGNKISESQYYYDSSVLGTVTLGNLTKEADWVSGTSSPLYASSTSAYNSYGLVTSKTDALGHTTTYGYDASNLYIATTTNPLSQISYATYDYPSGKVATSTDPNGNVYTNTYDGLGRLLLQYEPSISGTSSAPVLSTQYTYTDTALPSISKTQYLSVGTSTATYAYLDGFGRVMQQRSGAGTNPTTIASTVNYLIVAGGGGGGGDNGGGGGGAGAMLTGTSTIDSGTSYTITLGTGGSGGPTGGGTAGKGGSGGNSSVNFTSGTVTATGGGGGGNGGGGDTPNGISGGSGGGGGAGGGGNGAGGTGTTGGNNGGSGVSTANYGSGGGGGASAVGSNAVAGTSNGNGGNGTASSISGSAVTYAGGGGGGGVGQTGAPHSGASGGTGGGGSGGTTTGTINGSAGTANTGAGGGGGGTGTGGAGGSGIVIISAPTGTVTNASTAGGTYTSSGGNDIWTFTSGGTFSPNLVSLTLPDDSTIDYQYNNLGLLAQESLPYFSLSTASTSATTNTNLYSVYAYDPMQRVKSVTNAVGSTTYAYNNWTTTITDADSHLKDLSYDAYGNLIKVTEHNGVSASSTAYVYDGNKNLLSLTDALGNVRNFTYDGLNRELTSQDLHTATDTSFGNWTYTYDTAGNKLSTLDPKSQSIQYTYDSLNRMLTETVSGQGIQKRYVYDSCSYGIGQVCSVGTASATTTYAYDPLGHVTNEIENINSGSSYTTQYSYDQQGNPLTQTYPDSSFVTYSYNSKGQLNGISDLEAGTTTPKTIIADVEYGPDGQVTYQRDGNSVETFNTYNQNALYRLISKKTVGPGTGHLYSPQFQMRQQSPGLNSSQDLSLASPTNPIELPSARTTYTKTYLLGKSTSGGLLYTTEFHTKPQFVPDASGNLVPLDSLSQVTAGASSVNITQGEYSADVQDNPVSSLFTLSGTGGSMAVAFHDTKASIVAPTESTNSQGTVFIYTNSLGTGEGLEVVAADNYLQKNILLTTVPSNPSNKTNYSVTFKLASTNGTGALDIMVDGQLLSSAKTITSSNEAEVISPSGVVAYIWPPSASDSSAYPSPTKRIPVSVTYALQSNGSIFVTKNIPYSWLSTATYPVRADLTFSGYAGNGDGYVLTQPYPGSWATQHADTTGSGANYTGLNLEANIYVYDSVGGYQTIERSFIPFNTSSLPSNAVISSSTLYVYPKSVYNQFSDSYANMNVYQGLEASSTAVVNSDVSKCGNAITNPTQGSSNILLGSIATSTYLGFPLNSTGLGWITATGTSQFCIREGHDATNNAVTYTTTNDTFKWSGLTLYSSEAGSSTDPYLTITYSVPDSPPATTTLLQAEDQTNPINVTDTQPHFSATYNDVLPGNNATNYEIQIATSSSGFSSPMWDSSEQTLSPNVAPGTQSQDLSYTGTALALDHTTYYWRIKFWDSTGNASPWTDGTANFTMADDGTHIQSFHYTYDPVGNITGILDDVNGSEQSTFAYDNLNRLLTASTTVSGFQTPYIRTYSYDALGNIISSDQGTYNYQGNTGANYADPDAVTSIFNNNATSTYAYDNNGNLLSDGTLTNIWNYLNQLTQAGKGAATSTYAYDFAGNRVKTIDTTGTTFYPNKYYSVLATTTPTFTKNIYANGVLVASIGATGTTSAATTTPLLDATSTSISVGSFASTTKSWTHTIAFGLNRLLVLTADILQSVAGVGSISSASYEGIPLTKVASITSSSTESELWYLIAPPSGTNTITVNTVGSTTALKFSLSDYTGINQLTPFDASSTATSSTGNPTIHLTTHQIGDLAVDTLNRNATTTATTNRTKLFSDNISSTLAAASYQIATSTLPYDTYTGTASQNWAMTIAAFAPATTSPTTGTTTTITYMHPDQLGSTNAVTNSGGLLTENLQYYPYGALRTDTITGSNNGQKRKYIGQQYDGSTGLDYLNARYYAGGRGQFLSEDPVFLGNPSQQQLTAPQSLNSYSYGNDNPILNKDPSGKFVPLILGGIAAYGFISSAFDAYDTYLTNFEYPTQFTDQERLISRNKTTFDAATLAIGGADLTTAEQVFLGGAGLVNGYASDHFSSGGRVTYIYPGQTSYSPNFSQSMITNVNVVPSYVVGTQPRSSSVNSSNTNTTTRNTASTNSSSSYSTPNYSSASTYLSQASRAISSGNYSAAISYLNSASKALGGH